MVRLRFRGILVTVVRGSLCAPGGRQKALEEAHHVPQTAVVELLTKHRCQILIAFGGTLLNAVGFYLVLSYIPMYLTELGRHCGDVTPFVHPGVTGIRG